MVQANSPRAATSDLRGLPVNNGTDCQEDYSGVRLYRDRSGGFQVGVCIQRMDLCLPLEEFVGSDLSREIIALRDAEYVQLVSGPPVDSQGVRDAD